VIATGCVRSTGDGDALVSSTKATIGSNYGDEPATSFFVIQYDRVTVIGALRSLAAKAGNANKNAADLLWTE